MECLHLFSGLFLLFTLAAHIEKVIEVVWLFKIKFHFTPMNGGTLVQWVGNHIPFELNKFHTTQSLTWSWRSFNVTVSWYPDNVPAHLTVTQLGMIKCCFHSFWIILKTKEFWQYLVATDLCPVLKKELTQNYFH